MLKKLIKYENKSVSKILVPLIIGVIVLSLISSLMLMVTNKLSYNYVESSSQFTPLKLLQTITGVMTTFTFIAIAASVFISLFILLQRYYKNFFGDEGYLTFTLPVKTEQLTLAKFITALLWLLVVGAAIIISIFIFILFSSAPEGSFINAEIFNEIWNFFSSLKYLDFQSALSLIEWIIFAFVAMASTVMTMYFAITIGSQKAKKHKVLGSILAYYLINIIVSTVAMVIMVSFVTVISVNNTAFYFLNLMPLLFILLYGALFAMMYIINNKILKTKLNLE